MININDLRVGNWVDTVTAGLNFGIQVSGIYEGKICFADGDMFDPKYVEPIPLQPEILEKAGFIKCNSHYGGYLIGIGEGEQIRIVHDESIGWHYPLNGYQRPKTNYLHQLQNLFFVLSGQELEFTP